MKVKNKMPYPPRRRRIRDPFKREAKDIERDIFRGSRSLFREPPAHPELARIISFVNPKEAERSAKELKSMFRKETSKARKLEILRATIYAANRAEAFSRKRNLSRKEREEIRRIHNIYKDAYQELDEEYKKIA